MRERERESIGSIYTYCFTCAGVRILSTEVDLNQRALIETEKSARALSRTCGCNSIIK